MTTLKSIKYIFADALVSQSLAYAEHSGASDASNPPAIEDYLLVAVEAVHHSLANIMIYNPAYRRFRAVDYNFKTEHAYKPEVFFGVLFRSWYPAIKSYLQYRYANNICAYPIIVYLDLPTTQETLYATLVARSGINLELGDYKTDTCCPNILPLLYNRMTWYGISVAQMLITYAFGNPNFFVQALGTVVQILITEPARGSLDSQVSSVLPGYSYQVGIIDFPPEHPIWLSKTWQALGKHYNSHNAFWYIDLPIWAGFNCFSSLLASLLTFSNRKKLKTSPFVIGSPLVSSLICIASAIIVYKIFAKSKNKNAITPSEDQRHRFQIIDALFELLPPLDLEAATYETQPTPIPVPNVIGRSIEMTSMEKTKKLPPIRL